MKKALTLITLLLVAVTGMAQREGGSAPSIKKNKVMEALVSDACRRGMSADGTYCIDNSKNKVIDVATAEKYLRAKGYFVSGSSSKDYMRFGEVEKILDKLTFLDPNNFHLFAFNRLKGNNNIQYSQLKNGKFFYQVQTWFLDYDYYTFGEDLGNNLHLYENVMWSGSMVDGLLDGHGIGFVENDNECHYFECDFKCGFPIRILKTKTLVRKNGRIKEELPLGKMCTRNSIANISVNWTQNKYRKASELHKALMKYAEYYYAEDARQIEADYNKMLKLYNNNSYEHISDLVYDFVNLYGSLNYDPKGVLSKAREARDAQDVQKVEHDMSFISKNYIIYHSYTETHEFEWAEAQQDTIKIRKAIRLATQKVNAGNNPFEVFYSAMIKRLNREMEQVKGIINSQLHRYYELKQKDTEYRAAMCDNCKIDGDKSTVPTGYSEGSWFFGRPAQSEMKGTIVMHNGKTVKWWFEWSESTKEVKVESDWLGYYKFKTEKEMMETIISVCKSKYCY